MKRTLLAVGVAVLVSLMFVPRGYYFGSGGPPRVPFFFIDTSGVIYWGPFALQTIFLSVLAAVIVNLRWADLHLRQLFPRRPKHTQVSDTIGHTEDRSREHDQVIRIYDETGKSTEMHRKSPAGANEAQREIRSELFDGLPHQLHHPVPVSEFATRRKLDDLEVIEQIKHGQLKGVRFEGDWYVDDPMICDPP